MQVQLQRAFSPEYMVEEECGLCGVEFRVEGVIAWTERARMVCPECIAYLSERNPERFPSIDEYRAAVERNPEPLFSSDDEVLRVEAEEPAAMHAAYSASYVS